jgi:hypothetical protein
MEEAQSSTRRLCGLVEEILRSNADLSARMRNLEENGSVLSGTASVRPHELDIISLVPTVNTEPVLQSEPSDQGSDFSFEADLQSSWVYQKGKYRFSTTSLSTSVLQSAALSVFSHLSLSQVSDISVYALPICARDLRHSEWYIFGDAGIELGRADTNSGRSRGEELKNDGIQNFELKPDGEVVPLYPRTVYMSQSQSKLKGRYAPGFLRRQAKTSRIEIGHTKLSTHDISQPKIVSSTTQNLKLISLQSAASLREHKPALSLTSEGDNSQLLLQPITDSSLEILPDGSYRAFPESDHISTADTLGTPPTADVVAVSQFSPPLLNVELIVPIHLKDTTTSSNRCDTFEHSLSSEQTD